MVNNSSLKIENEFKRLRRKLLDLTLRNQLLHFRPRTRSIEVVNASTFNVYQNIILNKNKMQFIPNKKEKSKKSRSKFLNIWEHPPLDININLNDDDRNLQTNLTPSDLQKRLFYINQQARTMFQEQGYNILYLVLGFLEWEDVAKGNELRKAPLILIPVDLERKKVGKSFSLSWNEDDIQDNISLEAKLKEEGITLPKFDKPKSKEGFFKYFNDVKKSISSMKNWKIKDEIALGFFSFTKFVMYRDLDPTEWDEHVDLTEKELIKSIFNPDIHESDIPFDENEVDTLLNYKDMYHVLDADSSQISVIEDVKNNRNLVVEGPPGTGKSQTIVNLIGELLAQEKSVLFVSEKMAALEVVKSRLDNVGLGKFCLELHSHNTRKKQILKELNSSLNDDKIFEIESEDVIRRLESLKYELNDYNDILHERNYLINLSPFELYGMKENASAYFSKKEKTMPLVIVESPEIISKKELEDIIIQLENLSELYNTIPQGTNSWINCSPKSLLPNDLREIDIRLDNALNSLKEFKSNSSIIYDKYGINNPSTIAEYREIIKAMELMENIPLVDGKILSKNQWSEDYTEAKKLINLLEEAKESKKLLSKFNENISDIDIDELLKEFKKSSSSRLKLFNSTYKGLKEEISSYYKNKIPNSDRSIIRDLESAKKHSKILNELEKSEIKGINLFGDLWHVDVDINELKKVEKWMIDFNKLLSKSIFTNDTIELLSNEFFDISNSYDKDSFIQSGNDFIENLDKLKSKLNARSSIIFKRKSDNVPLDKWEEQLNQWKKQLPSLNIWTQYLDTKNIALKNKSGIFVKTIEEKSIDRNDVKPLVEGNFADSLLNKIFNENKHLISFIGELHENRIEEFRQLDMKILEINRKRIFNKLNSNLPQVYGSRSSSEESVLAGEFSRKKGHLSVRKLLEKAGGTIKNIKPCFMMSPLSIAQYLDPTNTNLIFDVVIFDEASQVKPEDALGAFMRAKTAVVMGDTQQLPPTSFFDKMGYEEDDEEEVAKSTDMESILHLCKLAFPVKMLKWHYRSRHESLINVSNNEFYDKQLLVYPSPSYNDEDLGLKFIYDEKSVYDRGNTSANKIEAENVVKEIFKHLNRYGDSKSLGVGTFSISQRNAILEELEIERKNHPELEQFFSENKKERFFVKNLETIQGDERDVILISIGYGFDKEKNLGLNFGPLNQDGGERRLNVLITRAREKCIVFSNFKANDINLTHNSPFGVKALKSFLEYADNSSKGTLKQTPTSEKPFEDAINSFLTEKGYEVHKNVGSSKFRVDLAIVSKDNPGQYILGIECDGKIYNSSKVSRDRDRLREQILKGLGWNIYHLWSTDWYRNRELSKEKLLLSIEKAEKETNEKIAKRLEEKEKMESYTDDDMIYIPKSSREPEDNKKADSNEDNESFNISNNKSIYNKSINHKAVEIEIDKEDDNKETENKIKNTLNDKNLDKNIKTSEIENTNEINESLNNKDLNKTGFDDGNLDNGELVDNNLIEEKIDTDLIKDTNNSDLIEYKNKTYLKDIFKNDLNKDIDNNDLNDISGNDSVYDNSSNTNNHYINKAINESVNFKQENDGSQSSEKLENEQENKMSKEKKYPQKISDYKKVKKVMEDKRNKELKPILDNNVPHESSKDDLNKLISFNLNEESDNEEFLNQVLNNISSKEDSAEKYKNDSSDYEYDIDNDDLNNQDIINNDISNTEIFNKNLSNNDKINNENSHEQNSKKYDDFKEFNEISSKDIEKTNLKDNIEDSYLDNTVDDSTDSKSDDYYQNDESAFNEDVTEYDDLLNSDLIEKDSKFLKINKKVDDKPKKKIKDVKSMMKTVAESLSEFKEDLSYIGDEMKHINDSLKQIEDFADRDDFSPENQHINMSRLLEDEVDLSRNSRYSKKQYKNDSDVIVVNDKNHISQEKQDQIVQDNISKKYSDDSKKEKYSFKDKDSFKQNIDSFETKQGQNINGVGLEKSKIVSEEPEFNSYKTSDYDDINLAEMSLKIQNELLNKRPSKDVSTNTHFIKSSKEDLPSLNKSTNGFKGDKKIKLAKTYSTPLNNKVKEEIKVPKSLVFNFDKDRKEVKESNIDTYQKNIKDEIVEKEKLEDNVLEYKTVDMIPSQEAKDFNKYSLDEVSEIINYIISEEEPIHEKELIKRLKDICGIKRATAKVKKTINESLNKSEKEGKIIQRGEFIASSNLRKVTVRKRVKPNINSISDAEIEAAINLVIQYNQPIKEKELIKETAYLFGFKATGAKTSNRVKLIIDYLLAKEKINKISNDRITFS